MVVSVANTLQRLICSWSLYSLSSNLQRDGKEEEEYFVGSDACFKRSFWFVLIMRSSSSNSCLIPLKSRRGAYASIHAFHTNLHLISFRKHLVNVLLSDIIEIDVVKIEIFFVNLLLTTV